MRAEDEAEKLYEEEQVFFYQNGPDGKMEGEIVEKSKVELAETDIPF